MNPAPQGGRIFKVYGCVLSVCFCFCVVCVIVMHTVRVREMGAHRVRRDRARRVPDRHEP